MAAARMGAGILECDVTFTKDRELVCHHSQCDLHTTTNILLTPLAAKCSEPFTPAEFDPDSGKVIKPASAKCCTNDITLEEFKSLCGKMDAFDATATTVQEFVDATANWRTDLYSTCGTVISHAESIELFKELGAKMTPELKSPSVKMPYEGDYTQEDYAQQMIDEYKAAGVPPQDVWAQSFNQGDVLYWIDKEPKFGKQAVFLDGRYNDVTFDHTRPGTWNPSMTQLAKNGVKIIAPPMWMLLKVNSRGKIVPSTYAKRARAAGLDIITWTLERSGPLKNGGGWYYQTVKKVTNNDGDMYVVLDVLARDVGILGIFFRLARHRHILRQLYGSRIIKSCNDFLKRDDVALSWNRRRNTAADKNGRLRYMETPVVFFWAYAKKLGMSRSYPLPLASSRPQVKLGICDSRGRK